MFLHCCLYIASSTIVHTLVQLRGSCQHEAARRLKGSSIHRLAHKDEPLWSTRCRGFLPARDPLKHVGEPYTFLAELVDRMPVALAERSFRYTAPRFRCTCSRSAVYVNLSLPATVHVTLTLAHCQVLTFCVAASLFLRPHPSYSILSVSPCHHCSCLQPISLSRLRLFEVEYVLRVLRSLDVGSVGRGLVDAARDKFEPLEAAVLAETSEEVLERVHGLFG